MRRFLIAVFAVAILQFAQASHLEAKPYPSTQQKSPARWVSHRASLPDTSCRNRRCSIALACTRAYYCSPQVECICLRARKKPPRYQEPPNRDFKAHSSYVARVTAYSSDVAQTDSTPYHTADGKHVSDYGGRLVATNRPDKFPFGTQVRIDEDVFTVGDTMCRSEKECDALFPGERRDRKRLLCHEKRLQCQQGIRFDIWKPDKRSALRFGARDKVVEVVRAG